MLMLNPALLQCQFNEDFGHVLTGTILAHSLSSSWGKIRPWEQRLGVARKEVGGVGLWRSEVALCELRGFLRGSVQGQGPWYVY